MVRFNPPVNCPIISDLLSPECSITDVHTDRQTERLRYRQTKIRRERQTDNAYNYSNTYSYTAAMKIEGGRADIFLNK